MGASVSVEEVRLMAMDFGDSIKIPPPDKISKRVVSYSNPHTTIEAGSPKTPFSGQAGSFEVELNDTFDDVFYEVRFEQLRKEYHSAEYLASTNSQTSQTSSSEGSKTPSFIGSTFITNSPTVIGGNNADTIFDNLLIPDDIDERAIQLTSLHQNYTEFSKNTFAQLAFAGVHKKDENEISFVEFMDSYPSFNSQEQRADFILRMLMKKCKKTIDKKQQNLEMKLSDMVDILALGKEQKPKKITTDAERRHVIVLLATLLSSSLQLNKLNGGSLEDTETNLIQTLNEITDKSSEGGKVNPYVDVLIDTLGSKFCFTLKHFILLLNLFESKTKGTPDENMLRL